EPLFARGSFPVSRENSRTDRRRSVRAAPGGESHLRYRPCRVHRYWSTAMHRWTHRLTLAALLLGPLLLSPDLFAQSRGDSQPKTGQAEPRKGHAVPRDDDQNKRTEQDKKSDEKRRAEARRKDDERRRAEERRRLEDIRRPN